MDTCSEPNWCQSSDCDRSGMADSSDLAILCSYWLEAIEYTNLIGHWPMDDNADDEIVSDSSGNENHGTAQENTSILHTTGMIDGALGFNGTSDYINCSNVQNILGSAKTYTFWVKQDVIGDGQRRGIIYKNPLSGTWNGLTIAKWSDDSLRVFISGTSVGSGAQIVDFFTSTDWIFVAVVLDGSGNVLVYKDGVLQTLDSGGTYTTPVENDADLLIGKYILNDVDYHFDGAIDDVRIFGQALSQGEIEELQPPPPDDLAAHWAMDDNSASTTVVDSSGFGNDGTARLNTSAITTTGRIDSALTFDGSSDYIDCGNVQNILGSEKTYTFWVKQDVIGDGQRRGIIYKNPLSGTWNGLTIAKWNDDSLRVFINGASSGGSGAQVVDFFTSTDWIFVAVVLDDSGNVLVYKDGVLQTLDSGGTYTTPVENNADLLIGKYNLKNVDYHFRGAIDDIKIFDNALSQEEVGNLYNY
jgi:hypothetical protein